MKDNLFNNNQSFQDNVSIKATTTDNLGFIGDKKGIAAITTCLLFKNDD